MKYNSASRNGLYRTLLFDDFMMSGKHDTRAANNAILELTMKMFMLMRECDKILVLLQFLEHVPR